MRARIFLPVVLVLALVPFPNAGALGASFYEVRLVLDEPDDYAMGAFDLSGLYVSELYPFDFDTGLAADQVVIRVEPRSLSAANQCMVQAANVANQVCALRYDLHFRGGGRDHDFFVVFDPPGGDVCCEINATNTHVSFNQTSVFFLLERAPLGLLPGTSLERLYATSDIVRGDQREAADRVPGDNEQMPYDQKPELAETFAAPHALAGTYPFFTVEALTPLVRPTVSGDSAEFSFRLTPSPGTNDDTIRVKFDKPKGWSIVPSRGSTGPDPTGLLTGLKAGQSIEFEFTASPNDVLTIGDRVPIGVRFHSSSQGYVYLPAVVHVTDAAYDDPNVVFRLGDSGPFRSGSDSVIRFQVLDAAGAPLSDLDVDAAFYKEGRRVATVPATASGDHFEAHYSFPTGGAWTVEFFVHGVRPSPHGVFGVNVSEGHGAPGPGSLLALVALGALAFLRKD